MNLKKEYDRLNRLYFAGELPKKIDVRFSKRHLRGNDAGGHAHGFTPCLEKGCRGHWLYVDPIYRQSDCVTTMHLFHEMTHFRGIREGRHFFKHGKVWNSGMQELANMGAFRDYW
jgi:hypothetical protein